MLSEGWPLNQNGCPAASVTPATGFVASGTKGATFCFLGLKVTLWPPLIAQRTLSPAATVIRLGKYWLASAVSGAPLRPPCGGPAETCLVRASAAAGAIATAATARIATAPGSLPCRSPLLT